MMNGPFFRNYSRQQPSRSVPVQQTQQKPSPKVISVPVHFVSSDQPPTTMSMLKDSAALKIQKVFRGFVVRKSVKKIASIRNEVSEIERRIDDIEVANLILRDSKERLRVNETLMSLLFKLDSIRGVDSGIRDLRKAVTRKAIALQEKVDSIAQRDNQTLDSHSPHKIDIDNVDEIIDDHVNLEANEDDEVKTCNPEEAAEDVTGEVEAMEAGPQQKPSPKVISVPVHFVSSDQPPTTMSMLKDSAALKIQKVFRGFVVRKSVKKIASIRNEVSEIERRIDDIEVANLIRRDSKERLRVNETLMSLLFKLDSIRGVDSGIRDLRKAVTRKAIALQEKVDSIAQRDNQTLDSHSPHKIDIDNVDEIIDDHVNLEANEDDEVKTCNPEEADEDVTGEVEAMEAGPQQKPSPKVISVPVHFVSSDQPPTTMSMLKDSAALKIQKVFRGFVVRKSVKKIASIRNEVSEIERRIDDIEVANLIRRDSKERLRVNETLMSLLFKLDSIRGVDSGIRDLRKAVTRKAIALQEEVDSIAQRDNQTLDSHSPHKIDIDNVDEIIDDHVNLEANEDDEVKTCNPEEAAEDVTGEVEVMEAGPAVNLREFGGKDNNTRSRGVQKHNYGKENREILESLMDDNEKIMKLMGEISERDEMQTRMINSLSKRVEQLEKAAKLRKKKAHVPLRRRMRDKDSFCI